MSRLHDMKVGVREGRVKLEKENRTTKKSIRHGKQAFQKNAAKMAKKAKRDGMSGLKQLI